MVKRVFVMALRHQASATSSIFSAWEDAEELVAEVRLSAKSSPSAR
jgi:hypothetical protein